MQGFDDIILFLLLVLPAYVANAIPVVLGGGKTFDGFFGIKLFGSNKTVRGFISGLVFGTLAAFGIAMFLPPGIRGVYVLFGALSSIGTMAGDLLGSMVKRKMGVEEGKQFFLDQLLFIVVALGFGYPAMGQYYSAIMLAAILVLTYVFHIMFNVIANRLGMKKVPWRFSALPLLRLWKRRSLQEVSRQQLPQARRS